MDLSTNRLCRRFSPLTAGSYAVVSPCCPLFIGVSNLRIERRSLLDEFLEHLQPSMDALTGCDFPWAPRFVPGCFVSYRVLSKRVGENSMSVLSDSPYGSNLSWIMHHNAVNLQRVDYTKVLCPQETNSSN